MVKIKRKVQMNERELIKYLVDHESTNIYPSGISIDGAWISIEPEIETKVDFEIKEVCTDGRLFTVEVEEEITEDTVFHTLVKVIEDGTVYTCTDATINREKNSAVVEIHAILNGVLKLIWTHDKGLVE